MDRIKSITAIAVISILVILLLFKSCQVTRLQKDLQQAELVDTVIVNKPYKVEVIKEVSKPYKVLVYQKDTAARKAAEKETIITSVSYVRHNIFNRKLDFLKVDKIDTAGNIFSSNYNTQHLKEIKIDGSGDVQVKKRKYIGLKIAGAVAMVTAGYLGFKKITKKEIQ